MDAPPRPSRAPWSRVALVAAGCSLIVCASPYPASAGGHRTTNFVIQAPTRALAEEIGRTAEQCRRELAIEWLGAEMPPWSKPCPITANVHPSLGAGGETSFVFDRGEVFGWTMKVQGSRERVLDSVIPHEVTHTIFASHFRRPLPRWADEGACTTVEHSSEIVKQERMLINFLKTGRGIPFDHMFALKEYPQEIMPLYSQGHSVATFLIERRGKKEFLDFLADGMADENWPTAVQQHYGHADLADLQDQWLSWVRRGRPRLVPDADVTTVAAASTPSWRTSEVVQAGATTPIDGADGSVYSAMATSPVQPTPARPTPAGSVYDASRGEPPMRR